MEELTKCGYQTHSERLNQCRYPELCQCKTRKVYHEPEQGYNKFRSWADWAKSEKLK